jgi:hypothetical protein
MSSTAIFKRVPLSLLTSYCHSPFCGKLILNINYVTAQLGYVIRARGWELGTRGEVRTIRYTPLSCQSYARDQMLRRTQCWLTLFCPTHCSTIILFHLLIGVFTVLHTVQLIHAHFLTEMIVSVALFYLYLLTLCMCLWKASGCSI